MIPDVVYEHYTGLSVHIYSYTYIARDRETFMTVTSISLFLKTHKEGRLRATRDAHQLWDSTQRVKDLP